jgi:hypothetical protein
MRQHQRHLTSRRAGRAALLAGAAALVFTAGWAAHLLLLAAPAASTGATILAFAPAREAATFDVAATASSGPELLQPCDDAAFGRELAAAGDAALACPASCHVRGIVRRSGEPVAGIEVEAHQFCGRGPLVVQAWKPIVTDELGRFEAEFAPEATVLLNAQDVHSVSETRVLKLGDAPVSNVELELLPRFAIRGHVVYTGGRSAPGIEVQARGIEVHPVHGASLWADEPDEVATTDKDGGFELLLPRAGHFRLAVARDRGLRATEPVVGVTDRETPAIVELQVFDGVR